MSFHKLILLSCIILPNLLALDAVKIGISKPLDTTTTTTTTSTTPTTISTEDTQISEEIEPQNLSTSATTTTSTAKPQEEITTESEPEWPEFPPRKETTSSTKKPTTTTPNTTKKPLTKKSRTTTTKSPPTTTSTVGPDITTNSTEVPGETSALSAHNGGSHSSKYCFCDLTINGCDINCCCDPDCPAEAFRSFKCLRENLNDFELHEGRFEDFKFQHGLPTCEEKDGWLCVFKTNLPTSDLHERDHPSFSDTSHYYKWPSLLKEDTEQPSREFYMYGDALKLIHIESKDIRDFDLPSSLKPPYCQTMEPIKYLKSQKRTCLQRNDNLEDIQVKLMDFQDNYKVLQKPNLAEHLYEPKHFKKYTANITLRWCIAGSERCRLSTEVKEADFENTEVKEIQIKIFHNFTTINGILIELWHREVDVGSVDTIESWLSYDIQYLNGSLKEVLKNRSEIRKSKPSSGPYGYTLGKPVILGKYVAYNKSLPLSEKNQQLDFFATDLDNEERGGHSINILEKYKGLCGRSEKSSGGDYINYGVNFVKQCKIRMNNDTTHLTGPAKANYTTICLTLQNRINQQLFNGQPNISEINSYYISKLGKPKNNSEHWIQLNVFNADFNQVFGQYLENTGTFICRNILLSVMYEFHMGYVDLSGGLTQQQHQNIIEYAALLMGERHDLEFSLDEMVEVPITMSVRFYDINEKAASASSLLRNYFIILMGLIVILNA
ncbi:tectonic [Musca vetustissima]|uniref:tectonic n=1 Tax=Musca vetustissima TaxID=27455 RepID=UPI002AB643DB|nr:tectonic [Musca vetustissima]